MITVKQYYSECQYKVTTNSYMREKQFSWAVAYITEVSIFGIMVFKSIKFGN